jgi:hypothetical protein
MTDQHAALIINELRNIVRVLQQLATNVDDVAEQIRRK